jgi:hypothetical protein
LNPAYLEELGSASVRGVVILHGAFHVLELVQDSEHVDELAEGEQVRLRDKVLAFLLVREAFHFAAEAFHSFPLQ